jgi:hypothetical protein
MPVYNLANVLGMSNDQINSMFSNPTFQQDFGSMFANNPNMYSGVGNLFTNNPTFKSAFQTLMGSQDWSNPSANQYGGGGGGGGVTINTGGGGATSGPTTLPTPNFANAPPMYTGPGASAVQLAGGLPPNYASMFQPPSLYDLGLNPNTGRYGMTQQAPLGAVPAASPYDPTSLAQFNTGQQTAAGLAAQAAAMQPKVKSPSFWDQALQVVSPLIGIGLSSI